jgi:hypothetical protein
MENEKKYITSLVNRVLEESIQEKAQSIVEKLKTEMSKEVEEGNAFTGALAKAKKENKKDFTVDGKKYKVEEYAELDEKWKGDVEVEKTGEYASMSVSELDSAIKKLKAQNEKYKKEDKKVPESNRTKMSQLYFAKRAKQGWKGKGKAKVGETVNESTEIINEISKEKEYSNLLKYLEKKLKFDVNELKSGHRICPPKKSNVDCITTHRSGGGLNDMYRLIAKVYDITRYEAERAFKNNEEPKKDDKITMTEEEMITFIENIVNEQKTARGLDIYKKAHKGSGKENDSYIKSVAKKFKEYLKDGSKGKFDMEPKMFPKGNGQLAKMSKKAYIPSKAVDEYIENFAQTAGMENLDYDEIKPNEEWIEMNIEGSSKTGNSPDYANAEKTDLGKKVNEKRKKNYLAALKRQSYNKAPQPVTDFAGETDAKKGMEVNKIFKTLESTENSKKNKINEEVNKMFKMINYNQKTQ